MVHEIRRPVPDVVADTDLHSLPDGPPVLLRGPWICEVRDSDRETLFGDTMALGGYQHGERICLIGLGADGGARVGWWTPRWAGGDIEDGAEHATLVELDGHYEWTAASARFAVVFGLLLDSAHTPLRWTDEGPRLARRAKGERREARPWAVRRVYVDGGEEGRQRADGRSAPEDALMGRVATERPVSGHLKRQPCGPGGCERRWIYVAGYAARRWLAPQARVIVGTQTT